MIRILLGLVFGILGFINFFVLPFVVQFLTENSWSLFRVDTAPIGIKSILSYIEWAIAPPDCGWLGRSG